MRILDFDSTCTPNSERFLSYRHGLARATSHVVLAFLFLYSASASAFLEVLFSEEGEWEIEASAELRQFESTGEFGQDATGFALRFNPEYYIEWNDGADHFKFNPYIRLDAQDSNRSIIDFHEAYWGHVSDNWEMKLGMTRVFWGRTEFLNVVDSVNQSDFVDGARKAKLGQPVLQFSLVRDDAIIDFYALLGFRERTFPGPDGRLRTPIPVDTDNARYDPGSSRSSIGFAARWAQPAGDYSEMAVSVFSGVARTPNFSFNFDVSDPMLIPVYYRMEQIGLEWETIYDGWVGKLEVAGVTSQRDNYFTAVAGVEYTFGSVFGSDIDLTAIFEYLWDERAETAPSFLEHDFGIGLRATFNDEYGTEFLLGGLIDPDTDEKLIAFEGSRRIGDSMKLSVQMNYVLDRGRPEQSDTSLRALEVLRQAGNISERIDLEFLANFILDVVREYGLEESLFNPTFALDTLQQLERLADADRKISILESDSYVQFELTYYF